MLKTYILDDGFTAVRELVEVRAENKEQAIRALEMALSIVKHNQYLGVVHEKVKVELHDGLLYSGSEDSSAGV